MHSCKTKKRKNTLQTTFKYPRFGVSWHYVGDRAQPRPQSNLLKWWCPSNSASGLILVSHSSWASSWVHEFEPRITSIISGPAWAPALDPRIMFDWIRRSGAHWGPRRSKLSQFTWVRLRSTIIFNFGVQLEYKSVGPQLGLAMRFALMPLDLHHCIICLVLGSNYIDRKIEEETGI